MEGRAWSDLASPFDRLPARAEGLVRPPVWMPQRASAGVCARFVTNAKEIQVRWTLTSEQLAMPHADDRCGVDLYGRDETGQWRWVGTVGGLASVESLIAAGLDGKMREYLLYLLYNGVSSVEMGLPADARSRRARRAGRSRKPVVFGVDHPGRLRLAPGDGAAAILGRRLDGGGEPRVLGQRAHGPGTRADDRGDRRGPLRDRLPAGCERRAGEGARGALRETLRAQRPDTPILLVEDRATNAQLALARPGPRPGRALRDAMEALRAGRRADRLPPRGRPARPRRRRRGRRVPPPTSVPSARPTPSSRWFAATSRPTRCGSCSSATRSPSATPR